MQKIQLYIPMMPPSVNDCYKRNRWGGMRLSKDGVDFKRIVSYKVKRDGINFHPVDKMRLTIEFHSPYWMTKKGTIAKKDVSNNIKVCEDALMEALGLDDKNNFELHIYKIPSEKTMVIYTLEELSG